MAFEWQQAGHCLQEAPRGLEVWRHGIGGWRDATIFLKPTFGQRQDRIPFFPLCLEVWGWEGTGLMGKGDLSRE